MLVSFNFIDTKETEALQRTILNATTDDEKHEAIEKLSAFIEERLNIFLNKNHYLDETLIQDVQIDSQLDDTDRYLFEY